jgi:glycosyltransferase involved in cell wall biosynthesis
VVRVRYDAQTFMRQRFGGISRHFTSVVAELDSAPDLGVEPVVDFTWTPNAYAVDQLRRHSLRAVPGWVPRAVPYGWNWLTASVGHAPVDAVHHTYYSARFFAVPSGTRRIVTVHDMIPERLAGTDGFTAGHLAKRRYVEAADLVICVSEATRCDLVELWGEAAAPTVVVPHALAPRFGPGLAPLPSLPAEYLLYAGARRGYKDFALLPDALASLGQAGLAVPLVVAGRSLTKDEAAAFTRLGLAPVPLVNPTDEVLARAVSGAVAVVQTSRYEGFGMTTLEAMGSGVAAVAADVGPMREVGGDVVRYFRPGDSEDLARVLASVVSDDDLRKDLGRQGVARAEQFSGRRLAERMAAAYRLILSGNG